MREYIITDKQMGLIQDFANVCVEGEKLPRIVRCRDCKHYNDSDAGCNLFVLAEHKLLHVHNPDGFCSYAKRRDK